MPLLTGKVYIALNGQRIRSKEGASLDIGGFKRDPAVSDAGVDGFTEAIAVPRVECKVNHAPEISLKGLQDFKDGTLVFETDTGKVFSLLGAWCAEPPKMAKGEIDLVFDGRECLEG
jgi:hypothetical protein